MVIRYMLDTDARQNRTDAQILGLKEYHRQTEELLQATIKERDCIMELKEILFIVEEDPEGGYTAQAFGESIFTEGDTIDAIKINIKDALRCHFEQNEIPIFVRLHIVREDPIYLPGYA